jgi:hypothetical protein
MRIVLLVFLASLVIAAPAAANTASLFASPGEFVTGGIPHVYDDTNSAISLSGTSADVTMHIAGNDGSSFALEFAGKPGSALQPGVYKNVERAALRTANRPGLDVTGNGHGCSTVSGSFEVEDISSDAFGQVERLKVLYEFHCDGLPPAIFGEVRYGEPDGITPTELRWPASQFGQPTARAGVALVSSSGLSLTSAAISGSAADDFRVSFPGCTGSCPPVTGVGVEFQPRSTGTRSATLHLTDSAGGTYDVPLRGSTYR